MEKGFEAADSVGLIGIQPRQPSTSPGMADRTPNSIGKHSRNLFVDQPEVTNANLDSNGQRRILTRQKWGGVSGRLAGSVIFVAIGTPVAAATAALLRR